MKISNKAEQLIGSEIIKLAGEIRQRQEAGEKIYNLTIGDFNPELFPIPKALENRICDAYKRGETNYPAANGIAELRTAVSKFLKNQNGMNVSADQILISGGARPLIYATYQTLLDPQDKVIYPVPSWNNNHYTHLSDGQKLPIETSPEDDFMPTAEAIKPLIKDATLIALCSPLNPTGTTFKKSQLEEICDMVIEENKSRSADEKPLYLLFDQIYWLLTYGDREHYHPVALCPEMAPYTIYIDGLSKTFAATGVRVGWSFGPAHVINKMKAILSHIGAWAPKAEQVATAEFLERSDEVDPYISWIKDELWKRLDGFHQGFQALKSKGLKVDSISPQAAIYLTIKLDLCGYQTPDGKVLETNRDVHSYVLNVAKLAVVPFYAFGAPESWPWYRLSVGTAVLEEIPEVFEKLEQALTKLTAPVSA